MWHTHVKFDFSLCLGPNGRLLEKAIYHGSQEPLYILLTKCTKLQVHQPILCPSAISVANHVGQATIAWLQGDCLLPAWSPVRGTGLLTLSSNGVEPLALGSDTLTQLAHWKHSNHPDPSYYSMGLVGKRISVIMPMLLLFAVLQRTVLLWSLSLTVYFQAYRAAARHPPCLLCHLL